MKKMEKTIQQIIRFRSRIETFFVSIEYFASSNNHPLILICQFCLYVAIFVHFPFIQSAFVMVPVIIVQERL